MKTKLITLSLLMSVCLAGKSQLSFNLGAGGSTKKSPTIETFLQYNFTGLLINTGFVTHTSAKADKGALFFGRMGYGQYVSDRVSFEVQGGYQYSYISADNKALNTSGMIASGYIILDMAKTPLGAMYAGVNYTKEVTTFNIGIRFKFAAREQYGCPATW